MAGLAEACVGAASQLALAADCGTQAVRAVRRAADPARRPDWRDMEEQHAQRMARLAGHHALRARPDLKAPDRYTIAQAEAKRR